MSIILMLRSFSFWVEYYKAVKDKESKNRIGNISVRFRFVSVFVCLRQTWCAAFNVQAREIKQ